MKTVGFLYDEIFLRHETPQWHPETKERLISILRHLKGSGMWDKLVHVSPLKADFADIALIHSERYIEEIKKAGEGYLDPDTYMSRDSLEAALFAAGALIVAADRCKSGEIERAFCAVRPPGHHAEAGRAMGFCLFNNIAIGARYAQKIGYRKVFIVDFDVHHGNGTQHSFESDDTVFYFSSHQYPHYPGTGSASEKGKEKGEGFTHNVPLPGGAGDGEFHAIYRERLPALMKAFEPDIVFVSAGYDIHARDPLAGFEVTNSGIRDIIQGILSHSANIPYIFTLEGGYNLDALGESVVITIEEMMED